MNPRLVGKVVRWNNELFSPTGLALARSNQGIHLGDIGLVVSQSVTELQVLIRDHVVFFHLSEVEEV